MTPRTGDDLDGPGRAVGDVPDAALIWPPPSSTASASSMWKWRAGNDAMTRSWRRLVSCTSRTPPEISTGTSTCPRRRPDTGVRARTAKLSPHCGPATTGGVARGTASSKGLAAPFGSTTHEQIGVASRPDGHVSTRSRVTSAGSESPCTRPRMGDPATAGVVTSSSGRRPAGHSLLAMKRHRRSPAETARTVAERARERGHVYDRGMPLLAAAVGSIATIAFILGGGWLLGRVALSLFRRATRGRAEAPSSSSGRRRRPSGSRRKGS